MTTLSSILPNNIISASGNLEVEIKGITFNSQKVKQGFLFVALSGSNIDGSAFIFDAIEKGAAAILTESPRKVTEVPLIRVDNARKALSQVAAKFYQNPSESLNLIGITGTKGKTTITYLTQSILKQEFKDAFRIGTVEYDMGYKVIPAKNTTPESQIIHDLLKNAKEKGIKAGVMEVSSHALKCWRVEDISFKVAGFTNLSLEHTEFHPDMADYFSAKTRLFTRIKEDAKPCVIGIDDDYGQKLNRILLERGQYIQTVSVHNTEADIHAKNIEMDGISTKFTICSSAEEYPCKINLAGEFNIFNALMSAGLCRALNISWDKIVAGLEALKTVPGRFETIQNSRNINIIVDYAHSPAALENVLKTVRPITSNRVISVFGCGGNRSHEKRPIMGKIALLNSDVTIVTSDNPRKETPDSIIEQIMEGINATPESKDKEVYTEADRKLAIHMALKMAKKGDTVVIAGKGHETGQTFADRTVPFDDKEVVKGFFAERDNA